MGDMRELEKRLDKLEGVVFEDELTQRIYGLEDQLMRERKRSAIFSNDFKDATEKYREAQAKVVQYETEYGAGRGIKMSRDQAESAIEWFLAAATGTMVPGHDQYSGFMVFERICTAFGMEHSKAYETVWEKVNNG